MFSGTSNFLNFFRDDSHTLFDTFFIPDGDLSDGPDTLLYKFGIDLVHVFLKFLQDQFIIFVVNNS